MPPIICRSAVKQLTPPADRAKVWNQGGIPPVVGSGPVEGTEMKASLWVAPLVLASLLPFLADASELKPLQAGTFVLGTHTVSIHYTVSGEAFEVVTTIAPEAGTAGAPIRFIGLLPPGQKQVISVGSFGTSLAPETLELLHQGAALSARRVANGVTG